MVLAAKGDHFSAGLDLSEMGDHDTLSGVEHSRMWHRALELVEFGPVPVICALHGAVVGGGLELAAATHLRVAERSTFYALPEGMRGVTPSLSEVNPFMSQNITVITRRWPSVAATADWSSSPSAMRGSM